VVVYGFVVSEKSIWFVYYPSLKWGVIRVLDNEELVDAVYEA
jgi:hypothetical protein